MNAMTSAMDQPLSLRRRPELESREITYKRQTYWSIKDPSSLRYYQLRDEEHFILSRLDGRTSLLAIQEKFQEHFAPRRIDLPQLNWFLGMLHREGLVVSDAAEQGQQLIDRRRRFQRRQFWGGLSNLLAIRFRGVDPSRLVDGLYPLVRWAYTPWCVAGVLCVMFAALMLLMFELPYVLARLPTFGEFFSAHNILWMAVALASAKVLHELSHAITCRHFGGQCRELGVMLLVFTPCLYCNVSDSWMLPSKWKRIAVSAAGMYVELGLASVCLLLWWFSEPGAFNALCLNLVFVCSVGTVLFNGNPLLRYDGYFILADWCEMPNLGQRGGQYVRDLIMTFCTGVESNAVPPARGERAMLVSYTLLSWGYRVFLVTAILWFCHAALKPYGLQSLAVGLAIVTVGGMVAMPLSEAAAALRDPVRRRKLNGMRLVLLSIVATTAAVLLLAMPFPYRVNAPVVLEPNGADPVYVTAPGRLLHAIKEGERVKRGEVIAQLENIELEKTVARLQADLAVQQNHVQTLTRHVSRDTPANVLGSGGQLPAAMEALADLENRLRDRVAEVERLTLRAPRDGVVLPPRPVVPETPPGELVTWSGTPLEMRNRGGVFESGTRVCWVGDPQELVAQLMVDESVIALVRRGQRARIRVDELPGQFLSGTVTEIARWDTDEPLPELVAKNLVPVRAGQHANLTSTTYQVRVELDPHEAVVPLRASGRAVIVVEPLTLGKRGYDFLCRTFRLEL